MAPAAAILALATASSSAVLIPGATASAAACRAPATTCPASHMNASCGCVLTCTPGSRLLRMVPPDPLSRYLPPPHRRAGAGAKRGGGTNTAARRQVAEDSSAHEPAQSAQRPFGDLVHRPGGVQAEQGALIGIKGDQRGGLLLVHLQPVPDRLLAVIIALEQLAATVVADPGHRRWIEADVPDPAAAAAGTSAGQPPHYLVVVDHELEHHVQLGVPGEQHLLERLGLRHVPREAVEQEAGLGVLVREP